MIFSEMRREPEKMARSFCRPRDYRASFEVWKLVDRETATLD
jgi:hypothetical protein